LLTTLKNLFFQDLPGKRKATSQPLRTVGRSAAARGEQRRRFSFPQELDSIFYGCILGVQSPMDEDLNRLEKTVLRKLDELLAADTSHGDLVPRLPAVIPRIISSLRDEDSSIADLAEHIGRDAVLLSDVLRLANSPFYRVGKEITSLDRAVCMLGKQGLRQLVANAAFKPLINRNSGHFTRLSSRSLWMQSEKTAIACDCLASRRGLDRFHAYLAGIVHHVGLSVAMRTLDDAFDGSDAPRSNLFRHKLVERSTRLSATIATEWEFPQPVIDALWAQIARPGEQDRKALDDILYAGDKLSKMHVLSILGRYDQGIKRISLRMQSDRQDHCLSCFAMLSV
jgi:HD-like signal output (HDOD) protein